LFISWIEILEFGEVIIFQLHLIITIPIENNFRTIIITVYNVYVLRRYIRVDNTIKMQQMWQRFNNNIVSYITTHNK